jgi:hypothetical protein
MTFFEIIYTWYFCRHLILCVSFAPGLAYDQGHYVYANSCHKHVLLAQLTSHFDPYHRVI